MHRQIAPNAFYCGSIDYTSTNPWGEQVEERDAGLPGKGFIEFDLETGKHTFHHLEPSRRLIDLPPFSARRMSRGGGRGHRASASRDAMAASTR